MAMTVRLPEDVDRALTELAAKEHTSKHALLIEAVSAYTAARARRSDVDRAVDFVLDHDAELLRRLEDA